MMYTPARILIVDDDSTARESLRSCLSNQGYDLELAANGAEGLSKATAVMPDLVLLDVMMPHMNGFEACRLMRADPSLAQVPVILITGLDDHDSRVEGLEAGADDFISKPYDRVELRARVHTIVRLNRYRRLLEEQERRLKAEDETRLLYQELQRRADSLELAVAERTHELRLERDRTHAILEALGEAVVVIDGRGMVQYVNPAFATLSGYTREEALGQDVLWWEAIHQPGGPMAQVMEAVSAECVWSGEVVGRRKDGTLYDAMLTVAPFGDLEHPQVSGGFVSVSRDITPLREANRLKDQFVSNVSHELRTPLSIIAMIAGNLDLFYRRLGNDQRQAMIRDLRAQARLLSDLIEDILEISRLDSQRMAAELVLLNLAELACTEADGQRSLAEGKRQTLSVIYADELVVRGDGQQLRQVIRNLLNNAVKFTPDGGQIVCECQRLGNGASSATEWPGHESLPARPWAAVRVADTGIGIPAEHLPHIFERFYRAQPQGSVPGTGLGLAIVKELVERHGGYVGVASTPGKGSVLAFYLPIAEQE